jgi:hypothetical protein
VLVKNLKVGMLLKPKDNAVFHMWGPLDGHIPPHLECHVPQSWRAIPDSFSVPVIYLGKAPKERPDDVDFYEYRHRVFVPSFGREVRMASECWRSVEPVE